MLSKQFAKIYKQIFAKRSLSNPSNILKESGCEWCLYALVNLQNELPLEFRVQKVTVHRAGSKYAKS